MLKYYSLIPRFCVSLRLRRPWVVIAVIILLSVRSTWASDPLQISYTLAKSQPVSINIYDSSGHIVRELLHCAGRKAGAQTETWDGRDGQGQPLPQGTYTWKMLSVPGFGAEFITSVGVNYVPIKDAPFWAGGPGCHGGPDSVTADADGFYVGAASENIETDILKQSSDGSRCLWTNRTPAPWVEFTALAVVDKTLYAFGIAGKDAGVYRYDKDTGALGQPLDSVYKGEKPTDMAVSKTSLIFSYPTAGLIRWMDFQGKETRQLSIPGALSVDVGADETIYVMTGSSMVKVAQNSSTAQPFLSHLSNPLRAAINPKNGDIYVLLNAPKNQVQRYSSAGRMEQTYGVAGGRKDGAYQPQRESFRGASDIAVMPNGNFWVTEPNAAPRRTAEFKRDGSVAQEYYGGQVWAPWISPEPDNPEYVWMASSWGDAMRIKIDFAKRTWEVNACVDYKSLANGMIINHGPGELWEARVHDGTLYLCRTNGGGCPAIIKVDRQKLKFTAVVVGLDMLGHDPFSYPKWTTDKAKTLGAQSVLWTDANGDGSALNADGSLQESELTFFPQSGPETANPYIDKDLNYIFCGGTAKYTVTSWNKEGAPFYSSFPGGTPGVSVPPRIANSPIDGRWSEYACTDLVGNTWGAFNPHITGWGNSKDSFLARWNPDGKLAWEVGHYGAMPGQFRAFRRIFGTMQSDSGDWCVVAGAFSYEWPNEGVTPIYVYDEDGLSAGQLIGQPINQGSTPNIKYGLGGEALSGTILRAANGDVLFYSHWINEGRIYKITGWNDWQKAQGTVDLPANYTAPELIPEIVGPTGQGKGLRGSYFTSADCSGTPEKVQVDPKISFTPAALGNYSVRWEGTLTPRRTGWHMFEQSLGWHSPNAIWVDGKNVAEMTLNDIGWPMAEHMGNGRVIWLEAGKPYAFRLDYRRDLAHPSGCAGVALFWSEPETNGAFTAIPDGQFSPPSDSSASSASASTN